MRWQIWRIVGILTLAVLASFFNASTACAQTVATNRVDNFRTGWQPNETVLNPTNVGPATFGKLASKILDRSVQGQPLYVPNLNVNGRKRNVFFVVTYGLSVYAFDADDFATNEAPLWKTSFVGTPPSSGSSGLLSTPVIDVANKRLYVTVKTTEGNASLDSSYIFRLHALNIETGLPVSSRVIEANVPGIGDSTDGNGRVHFVARWHQQRPALLLSGGNIYLCFASNGDKRPYHGWILSYRASDLVQQAAYCVTPNSTMGGIWMAGSGPATDEDGNVYFVTANGIWNAAPDELGNSVLRFAPGGALSLLDYFTPSNTQFLNAYDLDMGSTGVMLVPGTNLALTGSKQGKMYVLNRNNLGGLGSDDGAALNVIQLDGHLHGTPVMLKSGSNTYVYAWAEEDFLKGWRVGSNGLVEPEQMRGTVRAPDGMPGGMITTSSNGTTPGTGIVWALLPLVGDAYKAIVPGALRAFDAETLTELWNSNNNIVDDSGTFAKFHPPTVANGKVFTAASNSRVNIYGLLGSTRPQTPQKLMATSDQGVARLYWLENPNSTSYRIYRSTSSGGTYTEIANGVLGNAYVDTTVLPGQLRFYKVAAENQAGLSAQSVWKNATISSSPSVSGGPWLDNLADVSNFQLNGSAIQSGSNVLLAGGTNESVGSMYWKTPLRATAFRAKFRFRFEGTGVHGLAFVIQRDQTGNNNGISAIGAGGRELGYGPDKVIGTTVGNSIAVKVGMNEPNFPKGSVGVYTRGRSVAEMGDDLAPFGFDLRKNHLYEVLLSYQTTSIRVIVKDMTANKSFTKWYRLTIPPNLDNLTGWVGMSAASSPGGTVRLLNFNYGPV
jgi:hypothetical protein